MAHGGARVETQFRTERRRTDELRTVSLREGRNEMIVFVYRTGNNPGRALEVYRVLVIRAGDPQAVSAMTDAGARLMMRLYGLPQPLVIASTGHAVALGAFCLLTSDHRVGAAGDFRIGLNEVAIGMSLPPFGLMLANERLSKRHLARATLGATLFAPQAAKDAGFLDEVAEPGEVRDLALGAALKLASLDGAAFAAVKSSLRGPSIAAVLAELDG